MALPPESQLVVLFARLLAASPVVLLFAPVLRHAWLFAASPLGFALVALAVSDPVYFIPVVVVTMAVQVASPTFVYRRLRAWFEAKRGWGVLRLLVLPAFLVLAGFLVYDLVISAAAHNRPALPRSVDPC